VRNRRASHAVSAPEKSLKGNAESAPVVIN
jgi:hypothetical protein